MHTQEMSVAELHPWDSAPETRQADAHAETPATLVVAAPAEDVCEAVPVSVTEPAESVAVTPEPDEVVVAPLQVEDWRARAAVTSAVPHARRHEVTALWKSVVHTQLVSVAEEQPSCSAPATRQAEAQAETPATLVVDGPAEDVCEAAPVSLVEPEESVAVALDPADVVEAPLQVDD